jgi:hypothetical protein
MERSTRADSNTYSSQAFPDLRTYCGVVDREQMAVIAREGMRSSAERRVCIARVKEFDPADFVRADCDRCHGCGVQRIRSLLNRTSGEKVTPDLNKVSGQVLHRLHGDAARRRIVNPMEVMNPVLDLPNRRFVRSARQSVDDVAVDIGDHGIGLGMGSAICRSIIGALDGGLWVPLQAGTVQ